MREAVRFQGCIEVGDLGIVEIEVADGGENREDGIAGWRSAGAESCAVEQDACGALALLGDPGGDARAAGEAREVDAVFVDREVAPFPAPASPSAPALSTAPALATTPAVSTAPAVPTQGSGQVTQP